MPATAVGFAEAARALALSCRSRGLSAPSFRSPPADPRARRTLRRRPDGGAVVSVRLRGRSLGAVVADLVDGVVAANGLTGEEAEQVRRRLMADLADLGDSEGSRPVAAA